jgi:hypothetical protein
MIALCKHVHEDPSLQAFTRRCLLWAYVLADPSDGHTTTIAGGQVQTTAACIAAALAGVRIVGTVGLVPNRDGTAGGHIRLEYTEDTPAVRRLALLAAHKWQAGLVELGAVTPTETVQ